RGWHSEYQRLRLEQWQALPKEATPATLHARNVAWQRELLSTQSAQRTEKLLARFVRNRTWQVPTLILLREDAHPTVEAREATKDSLEYVPRSIVRNWGNGAQEQDKFASQPEFALRDKLFARSMEVVSQMQEAGVPIMAGTDTAAPYVVPGVALHEELGLLVQAGLSPM